MRESFHQSHERVSNVQKSEGTTSVSKSVRRSIICAECKLPRRTNHWSDVCGGCLSKLPKVRCPACSRLLSKLQVDAPFCRRCAGKYSNLKSVCETCGVADYPLIKDLSHCRKCHRKARHKLWLKSMHDDIVCNLCGLTKPIQKDRKDLWFVLSEAKRCVGEMHILWMCKSNQL